MKWLFWNIRGVNKRYKQKEVREYIRSNKINLVGLVETKVKETNAYRIANPLVPGWGTLTNYNEARNGRVWILWDTNVLKVTGLQDDPQLIHCIVRSIKGDVTCYLTVVYGFNGIEQRRSLWGKLQSFSTTITDAWLVAGDFNAILYPKDRQSCNPVSYSETQEFSHCIQQAGLSELPWKGDYYTWTNKQPGADRVCSRLDRVFGNYEWMMKWSHVETVYDQPQISDHNPMILTLAASSWKGKVPFRFFNAWTEHDEFQQIVASTWYSTNYHGSMKAIWAKLKALKGPLKALNVKEFKSITQKIEHNRQELKEIQEQMARAYSDVLLQKEKEIVLKLERWSLIEESVVQQKARAKWIQLGDSNTKYFTAVMKERTQRKQITELTNGMGVKVNEPADIKREILGFYKSLMGSTAASLPAINRMYMANGPMLSQ
ncbi:PREDICTED: uncharacterized protein LOC109216089 [Nicotiana attenuata]|uniref:uncharacterized protein LOC109216089 n=1 Tax=Nicotiana attenuata TaxID=49451 RepID=UPI000905169F|nr:PREDICTED: uncharacterized protein LOC109216089 [Nicotiana attenuata]